MEVWVLHTNQVLIQTTKIQLMSSDSELLARNYLHTGNQNFKDQFELTEALILQEMDILVSLTADNRSIRSSLDSAAVFIFKRVEFSRKIIQLREKKGFSPAAGLVKSEKGKIYADKVNFYLKHIVDNELRLMTIRRGDSTKAALIMNISLFATAFFLLILIVVLARYFWNEAMESRRLVEELLLNENRMNVAEKLASFGALNVNLENSTINGSAEMYRIWGCVPDEKLNTFEQFIERVYPEDKAFFKQKLEDLIHQVGFETVTLRIIPERELRHVNIGITTYRDSNNKISSITGYVQDITDRVNAVEKLRRSEEGYRRIVETTTDGIWMVDQNNKTVFFNERLCQILEYSREELNSTNYFALFDPLGVNVLVERYDAFFVTKSGKEVWVNLSASRLFSENGLYEGLLVIVANITQRKLDEEALAQSEANLRTIFDSSEISYILINSDHKIVSFNKTAQLYTEKYFNKKLERGQPLISYYLPSREGEINENIERVKSKGDFSSEYSILKHSESIKWFQSTWINIANSNEKNRGFVLANKDITAIKLAALEREMFIDNLLQRNKTLEDFTYIVSHNLRAPVANIIGLGQILEMIGSSTDEQEVVIQNMLSTVKSLDQIVKDLNMILQIREHTSETKKIISLNAVFKDVEAELKLLISQLDIRIECDFTQECNVSSIYTYIHGVFYNLLLNSINFRRVNILTVIRIETIRTKNSIELLFKDNGTGIDLEKNGSDLFKLYRGFDDSVAGKGMGLFMVKTQVAALGGTITVKSKVGEGTAFSIMFPLCD